MTLEHHVVTTRDGWALSLNRLRRPGGAAGPPVLFVPGYGMNSFIVNYHPTGPSFAAVLLEAGLDPWGVDLRGTSTSRRVRADAPSARMSAQAGIDLPAVLGYLRRTTGAARVHAIGCSLGGSLLFAHAAFADEPGLDRLVAIGAPLTWDRSLRTRAVARVLQTAGAIPMRGTRRFARLALPIVARTAPSLLSVYLNPRITDVSAATELTSTVEDPVPAINRALARWMRTELRQDGRAVGPALRRFEGSMLVLHGSGDGIVPEPAALSVVGATGGPVEVVRIDHPSGELVGHADLFVSDIAPREVFARTARFLVGATIQAAATPKCA